MKYILASQSPRRKELLKRIIPNFDIIPSHIDESLSKKDNVIDTVKDISYRKALDIYQNHQEDIIIASDTIVVIDNQIIGKPKDINDARNTLHLLSNRKHEVITSYTIIYKDIVINKAVITDVYFHKLNDELINRYVATGSPLDKAGSYGIQDNDNFPIIDHIEGSYYNVMGLPIENLELDLKNSGLI